MASASPPASFDPVVAAPRRPGVGRLASAAISEKVTALGAVVLVVAYHAAITTLKLVARVRR